MANEDKNAKIIDFDTFKQQQSVAEQKPYVIPEGFTPTLMFYPVWVLVPNQPPINPS